jgi:hypothetical protein
MITEICNSSAFISYIPIPKRRKSEHIKVLSLQHCASEMHFHPNLLSPPYKSRSWNCSTIHCIVEIWPLGMNRCEKWLAVTSKNSLHESWESESGSMHVVHFNAYKNPPLHSQVSEEKNSDSYLGCFYSPSRHTTPNCAPTPHSALKCKFLYKNQFLVQRARREDSLPCPQFTVWILPFISKRISPLLAKDTIIFSAELNLQLRQSWFWKSDSPGVFLGCAYATLAS